MAFAFMKLLQSSKAFPPPFVKWIPAETKRVEALYLIRRKKLFVRPLLAHPPA
jgi:hypothetical protein